MVETKLSTIMNVMCLRKYKIVITAIAATELRLPLLLLKLLLVLLRLLLNEITAKILLNKATWVTRLWILLHERFLLDKLRLRCRLLLDKLRLSLRSRRLLNELGLNLLLHKRLMLLLLKLLMRSTRLLLRKRSSCLINVGIRSRDNSSTGR